AHLRARAEATISSRGSVPGSWPAADSRQPAPARRKAKRGRGLISQTHAAARLRDVPGKAERPFRQAECELRIQLSRRDFARGHLPMSKVQSPTSDVQPPVANRTLDIGRWTGFLTVGL